jgi:hypothetical protein
MPREPDGGADFAEGHQLDLVRAAKVPAKQIGRMLTPPKTKTKRFLVRLER